MDAVVSKGLATAFERDLAEATSLWGEYSSNITDQVTELQSPSLSFIRAYIIVKKQKDAGMRINLH